MHDDPAKAAAGRGPRPSPPAGWQIETPRLLLRAPQPCDFGPLAAAVLADAEVMRHVHAGGALDLAAGLHFCTTALDVDGSGLRPGVVVEKATGAVIGFAGPMSCTALGADDIEIGFVLARSAWGKGYGTELGRAQLDHAFGTLGCARVLALAAPANAGSIATITKLGMQFVERIDAPGRGPRNVYAAYRR
jgi:RimJ/RimL family protein N-acetyltransferase